MGATTPTAPLPPRIEIPPGVGLALVDGEGIALSAREHALLSALVVRRGRVIPREELYSAVWRGALRRGDRLVDVYVRKLRVKLAAARPGCEFIHTHTGLGYRFEPTRSPAFHKTETA